MKFKCERCNKEFERSPSRKSKYCSRECAGNNWKERISKKCMQCGQKFTSEAYKKRIFCSRKCSDKALLKPRIVGVCELCNQEFEYRECLPDSRYCSQKCSGLARRARLKRKCQHCQVEFYPTKRTSKFCSADCKYTSYNSSGYKSISISMVSEEEQEKFRDMFGKKGACHEHRLVMARHMGRCLETHEIVHHLNGQKRDNRIENLELLESKKKHHTGYGDEYYQKLQEAEKRIQELEAQLGSVYNEGTD